MIAALIKCHISESVLTEDCDHESQSSYQHQHQYHQHARPLTSNDLLCFSYTNINKTHREHGQARSEKSQLANYSTSRSRLRKKLVRGNEEG